ncbi:hypothetical protein [Aquimarina aggregata]|uniref:hypothetical protein n=1 Tax=Aquimarina aggregata TaxID=1642818 RepID=UPI0024938D90|nr:hypothetical protein [Aquimarina aggregata]
MPLNATLLANDIKTALKNNVDIGGSAPTSNSDAQSKIDSYIDDMASAIATAVVSHIKNNLKVTSSGLGNNGAPVTSNSTLIS